MSARPPRIGLIVDHPRRDLAGLCLVAHQLIQRGCDAILVPMYQQGIDVPLLGLDLIVVNYARSNNRGNLETYRALGLPVIVLDTEGGVLSEDGFDSPGVWAQSVRDSGLAELISGQCFWGAAVRDAFVAKGALAAAVARVTGSPRFDFCSPPWRQALRRSEQDYVLVNTNFSLVNPLLTLSAEQERRIFTAVGMDEAYARRLTAATEAAFARYLDAIERIFAGNAGRRFVIRPHPFERRAIYDSRFARYPNVRVRPGGNVLDAMANARCILHLNCGTAVEANLLGKVPIQLEPINDEILVRHTPLPRQISYRPGSLDEIASALERIEEIAAGFDFEGNLERHIRPYFGPLDGGAAARIADFAVEFLRARGGSVATSLSLRAALRSGQPVPSSAQRLQGIVGTLLGSRLLAALRSAKRPQRALKSLAIEDVARELAVIASCDPTAHPAAIARCRHPLSRLPLASLLVTRA